MVTKTSRSPKWSTMTRSMTTAALSILVGHVDRRGEQHLVVSPQIKPEGFGALDKSGYVCVAAEQIVNEFAPRRLLLSNHLPPGGLMALDQHLHGITDDAQDSIRCGPHFFAVPRAHDHRYLLPSRQAAERYKSTAWLASTPCSAARRPSRAHSG